MAYKVRDDGQCEHRLPETGPSGTPVFYITEHNRLSNLWNFPDALTILTVVSTLTPGQE